MQDRSNRDTEKRCLVCSIADTTEMRDQVYRLRYAGYLRKGSIDARADERFSDRFDATPNHFSFLVRDGAGGGSAGSGLDGVPGRRRIRRSSRLPRLAAEASWRRAAWYSPTGRRDALMQLLGYMAAMADFTKRSG